nr:hypothetical protein [Tanacetum cinerariifolium]
MVALRPENVVARHVTDDLNAFSGETTVPRYMKFFLVQKIVESWCFINRMRKDADTLRSCIAQLTVVITELQAMDDQYESHDSLLATKDAKRGEQGKLTALNDVIVEALDKIETQETNLDILEAGSNDVMFDDLITHGFVFILDKLTEVAESSRLSDKMKVVFNQARSEEKAFAGLMWDLSLSLRISVSKKRRLVAELEARVKRGDPARPLEHMREIVARDSELLGELEKLLVRAQVKVGLKVGMFGLLCFWTLVLHMGRIGRTVVKDYRLAMEINRVTVEVHTMVSARDDFIEELDSLEVHPMPAKLAEVLKQIQRKD